VAAGGFEPASYLIPVREVPEDDAPALRPVDARHLHVVPTAPFWGIAGYLRQLPGIAFRNWPVIRSTVSEADLLWIKAPASNAAAAALAARKARVPYFTWVAGSARAVVRGQGRTGVAAFGATSVAAAYDSVTAILERTGPSRRLDDAFFTSVVGAGEVVTTRRSRERKRTKGRQIDIVWAGRITVDKGLDDLLGAMAILAQQGVAARLKVVGDGPARSRLEATADRLGVSEAVRWLGFVADREAYMRHLRGSTTFVLASRAEGVPKVLIDAMAAGLPVIATDVGNVAALLDGGRLGRIVPAGDPAAIARAVIGLTSDPDEADRLAGAGLDFAADHTIDAQAARLVVWLRDTFPGLPWVPDRAVVGEPGP
jgi:glycosyltransferase involved in cell wall biosynthesis